MLKRKIPNLLFVIFVLLAFDTLGQDTMKMDLNQCLNLALKKNIQLNKSRLNEQTGYENLKKAKSSRYPNLNASVGQNFTQSKNVNPVIGGFQTQSSSSSNFSLSTGVSLYEGGYIKNDIRQKQLDFEIIRLNTKEAENNIILAIVQAYLNVLYAGEQVAYNREVVESSLRQVEQTENLLKAGSVAKKDLARMQSMYATDQYNLVSSENNLNSQLTALKQLLELDYGTAFSIDVPEIPEEVAFEMIPEMNIVVSLALETMPEIQSSLKNVEYTELSLAKARSAYYPSLILNGSLSTGYSDDQDIDFSQQLDNNFYQRMGLSLNIPIYNRYNTRSAVQISKINIQQAKLDQSEAAKSLIKTVETAHQNALAAQAQFGAAIDQLNASQESYRISRNQYDLGMLSTVELLQEKNNYLFAEQEYIKAKYNAILNLKILDFYMGKEIKL